MNKVDFPAIKPKDWPPEVLRLWNEAKQPVEIFEEGGIASDWSEAYIDNVELFYGQYLCFLVRAGLLDPSGAPKDRIGKPFVKDSWTPLLQAGPRLRSPEPWRGSQPLFVPVIRRMRRGG